MKRQQHSVYYARISSVVKAAHAITRNLHECSAAVH